MGVSKCIVVVSESKRASECEQSADESHGEPQDWKCGDGRLQRDQVLSSLSSFGLMGQDCVFFRT